MPGAGLEPAWSYLRGIFLPLQLSLLRRRTAHLWSGLSLCRTVREYGLGRSRQVSTLSLTPDTNQGLARDCHRLNALRFPRI